MFKAWVELDPHTGLRRLREAVTEGTPEQLSSLRGEPDESGGWTGRRQVVWLCEHLANFGEHFFDCEDILFRLAQFETEPGIGNNSTLVWQSLYSPALAHTEVPFDQRFPLVIRRIQDATSETLPLVLGAAFLAVSPQATGLPYPPPVVGGRIVPTPWRPDTVGQLAMLQMLAGCQTLVALRDLAPPLAERGAAAVIDHLGNFLFFGLQKELRELLSGDNLTNPVRRKLVGTLEHLTAFYRERIGEGDERLDQRLRELETWLSDLLSADLITRVQDTTARLPWDVEHASPGRFKELATALCESPTVLGGLAEWFDSSEAKSAGAFGGALGYADEGGAVSETIAEWLAAGRCLDLVANYLRGVSTRGSGLPDRWVEMLDASPPAHPFAVARVTLAADVSERGLRRLLGLVPTLQGQAAAILQGLLFNGWWETLSPETKAHVLTTLEKLAESGDPDADRVALDLATNWSEGGKNPIEPALVDPLMASVRRESMRVVRVDAHDWGIVMRLLASHRPETVADVLAATLTGLNPGLGSLRDAAGKALIGLASTAPAQVMEAIGRAILDPDRRSLFRAFVFRGLFEAIGAETVRGWVEANGREQTLYIARHLASPYVDEGGCPIVPPLTEWLLTTFETDEKVFREFCVGRHSNEARFGPVESREELQRKLAPFREFPIRRVRDWVAYELAYRDAEEKWDAQSDDELERL